MKKKHRGLYLWISLWLIFAGLLVWHWWFFPIMPVVNRPAQPALLTQPPPAESREMPPPSRRLDLSVPTLKIQHSPESIHLAGRPKALPDLFMQQEAKDRVSVGGRIILDDKPKTKDESLLDNLKNIQGAELNVKVKTD